MPKHVGVKKTIDVFVGLLLTFLYLYLDTYTHTRTHTNKAHKAQTFYFRADNKEVNSAQRNCCANCHQGILLTDYWKQAHCLFLAKQPPVARRLLIH
jgi:hypothetical protein